MKKVLTFGVYDLLHIGHVNLFRRARLLGDFLTVAVQDGEFVKKYKPNTNTMNDTDERLFMVSSIRYVDNVTIYTNVDEDIKTIDFDVLATGPDQNHDGFLAAIKWAKDHGKIHVVIPRTEGISSSWLKEQINKMRYM